MFGYSRPKAHHSSDDPTNPIAYIAVQFVETKEISIILRQQHQRKSRLSRLSGNVSIGSLSSRISNFLEKQRQSGRLSESSIRSSNASDCDTDNSPRMSKD